MTRKRSRARLYQLGSRALLAALVALAAHAGAAAAKATPTPAKSTLQVDSSGPDGKVSISAHGCTVGEALHALADERGFDVRISDSTSDMPLNLSVSSASLEDTLRQMLRGTSYALFYGADDGGLSRVEVLSTPPTPRPRPGTMQATVRR